MPNTLAHLGVQALATRSLLPRAELRWIALGCVIPDLPWIAQRAVRVLSSDIDRYDLRLYAIAQASLAVSLIACAAFACLAREPRRVFGVLSLNVLFHLLLDAAQTKWANGVHLFAPFSWELWNAELFWPESIASYSLTALGLAVIVWLPRGVSPVLPRGLSTRNAALAAGFGIAYICLPVALIDGPRAADNHSVRTLRATATRSGRPVEFDRAQVVRGDDRDEVVTLTGERIALVGAEFSSATRLSLRGTFVDAETLSVDAQHAHVGWRRDLATYAGLALIAVLWLPSWRSTRDGLFRRVVRGDSSR